MTRCAGFCGVTLPGLPDRLLIVRNRTHVKPSDTLARLDDAPSSANHGTPIRTYPTRDTNREVVDGES